MRGSKTTKSIFSAFENAPPVQGADVRPTLDHLVDVVCIRIVRDGRRRLLAIKAVQR